MAPATALAVNMHHYFVGMCRRPLAGRRPLGGWVLEQAADGHVFAAGHGEAGNDVPVMLSTSGADRVAGGWEITGHKIFGSLSPVWTYLGVHAMDTSDPASPEGRPRLPAPRRGRLRIVDTWDTLGMRAHHERRHGARQGVRPRRGDDARVPGRLRRRRPVPRRHVRLGAARLRRRLPGIARRAFDLAVAGLPQPHVDGPDPLDGPPPRGAASRRRDAHRSSRPSTPTSTGSARTGRTASTTAVTGRSRSWPASTTS